MSDAFAHLSAADRRRAEALAERFRALGAEEPEAWALSEVEAAARAVREERAAIVTEYRGLLEEMRTASAEQERRWEARFGRLESDAKLALEHQQACERQLEDERTERVALAVRLRLAEAKIAELGG